ncbi:MAG: ATP-binding protein [Pseudomonadota bacterium]
MTMPETHSLLQPDTFILRTLDIYNWGPFGGRHQIEVDPAGTAIIGPTGSGKTTLVDALMTLLVAQPRYNLASTGGHDSDRDLISYIRGVAGAGNDTGDNRHVARTGKTTTGLCATFASDKRTVQLGAICWIDSSSSANADRRDLWLFSETGEWSEDSAGAGFDTWLTTHHEGGARALKLLGKEHSGLSVFDTKRSYLAQVRRYFEVGDNAFTLLNRAAGLKQLDSIDDIFRQLVLDDHAAFERASEVASEFNDLAAIHAELDLARRQQESLAPIKPESARLTRTQEQANLQAQLQSLLPRWFAMAGHELWSAQLARLDAEIAQNANAISAAKVAHTTAQAKTSAAHELYLQQGGGRIEQTNEQIETQRQLVGERARNATDYQRVATALGINTTLDLTTFNQNRAWAEDQRALQESAVSAQEEQVYALGAEKQKLAETLASVTEELESAKRRPDSNLPGNYQDFRTALATALGTSEQTLPFVAELVEVKEEESDWRGAIERAIGGHRTRIIAPANLVTPALRWINSRDNRLHVRLLDSTENDTAKDFLTDGFTRKLNFKPHALREPLKALLARIDRHCVDTPDDLQQRPHSMTRAGLMSGNSGQFEKQDQRPLAQDWMTGFSNRDAVAHLTRAQAEAKTELEASTASYDAAVNSLRAQQNKLTMISQLTEIEFDAIDLPRAEAQLAALQERLALLLDPASDAGKARLAYESAQQAQQAINAEISNLESKGAVLRERRTRAETGRDRAATRIGDGLTEAQRELAAAHLPAFDALDVESLDQQERHALDQLHSTIEKLRSRMAQLTQDLVRLMERAKRIDNGALTEVGTEIVDIEAYLERLRVLNEEALPEKQSRFQLYLNQSSDQGVTQLLADIDNEISIIEERISELNLTLRKVNFQENRFVQLVPKRVIHESLRTLQRATSQLRSAALQDDGGNAQYRALEHLVGLLREASDNRRTLGARALLDPRYRLEFSYTVVDRTSGEVVEKRTSSQGGSGGEKEIIASYILTASLSYALCPAGANRPLFGTIILDEAFSKSSQSVAGRIISALKEFGLHAVFVTPNKEMRLLRDHTRSAVLVHRKGLNATLTSITWEELEAYKEERQQVQHEVTR